jgi:hypothetical protein
MSAPKKTLEEWQAENPNATGWDDIAWAIDNGEIDRATVPLSKIVQEAAFGRGMSAPGAGEPNPLVLKKFFGEVVRRTDGYISTFLSWLKVAYVRPANIAELRVQSRVRFRRAWRLLFASLPALAAVTVDYARVLVGRPRALLSRDRSDITARLSELAKGPLSEEDRRAIIGYTVGTRGVDAVAHLLEDRPKFRAPRPPTFAFRVPFLDILRKKKD